MHYNTDLWIDRVALIVLTSKKEMRSKTHIILSTQCTKLSLPPPPPPPHTQVCMLAGKFTSMPLPHTPIHSNLAGDSWKNTRSHTEERKLFWTDRRTTKRKGVLPVEHVNCNCKCKVLKQFKLSQDAAGNFRRGGEHSSVCLGKDPLRHCSQLYKLYIDWPCCFTSTANIKYRQGAKVLCCTGRRQGGNGGGGGGGGGAAGWTAYIVCVAQFACYKESAWGATAISSGRLFCSTQSRSRTVLGNHCSHQALLSIAL